MTGHRIGIFDLDGIIVRILLDAFDTFPLGADINIVEHDLLKQMRVLLRSKGRCLGSQTVKDDRCLQFEIVVVRKLQKHIRESELVELPHVAHLQHPCPVAIGNETQVLTILLLSWLHPMVVVLHDHEQVVDAQLFFAVENHSPDPFVVDVRPFVTPCDHHGLIHSYLRIGSVEMFHEFVTRDNLYIRKAMEADAGELEDSLFCVEPAGWRNHLSDICRIEQDTTLLTLAQHLVEIACIDL